METKAQDFDVLILVLMDNQNTENLCNGLGRNSVLILVLMDNQNTGNRARNRAQRPRVLILVLMDNQNT